MTHCDLLLYVMCCTPDFQGDPGQKGERGEAGEKGRDGSPVSTTGMSWVVGQEPRLARPRGAGLSATVCSPPWC